MDDVFILYSFNVLHNVILILTLNNVKKHLLWYKRFMSGSHIDKVYQIRTLSSSEKRLSDDTK